MGLSLLVCATILLHFVVTIVPEVAAFSVSAKRMAGLESIQFSTVEDFKEFDPYQLYSMLRLRSDVFVVEQTCVFLDLDDEDQRCFHMFATDGSGADDKRIIACLRIFPPGEGGGDNAMVRIGRVVTDKEYRSRGIARKLMVDAIELGRSRWKVPIKIGAQEHLDNFYGNGTKEKPGLGFRRISEVYDEDGIPHVDMVLDT